MIEIFFKLGILLLQSLRLQRLGRYQHIAYAFGSRHLNIAGIVIVFRIESLEQLHDVVILVIVEGNVNLGCIFPVEKVTVLDWSVVTILHSLHVPFVILLFLLSVDDLACVFLFAGDIRDLYHSIVFNEVLHAGKVFRHSKVLLILISGLFPFDQLVVVGKDDTFSLLLKLLECVGAVE